MKILRKIALGLLIIASLVVMALVIWINISNRLG